MVARCSQGRPCGRGRRMPLNRIARTTGPVGCETSAAAEGIAGAMAMVDETSVAAETVVDGTDIYPALAVVTGKENSRRRVCVLAIRRK